MYDVDYDNALMRMKRIDSKPRPIFDLKPQRQIMEDSFVKRYDGFIETIPKKENYIKKKQLI